MVLDKKSKLHRDYCAGQEIVLLLREKIAGILKIFSCESFHIIFHFGYVYALEKFAKWRQFQIIHLLAVLFYHSTRGKCKMIMAFTRCEIGGELNEKVAQIQSPLRYAETWLHPY